ncbi:hypothetical protein DRH29_00050 [candidate division Kazan bacterium]|uniref:Uncharacterized protein n=1 Tax=candidate division Kazan bacterium TaxID=2202143 RepID=A0A420ZDM5_UNCK3|nr:MAG: hypothetical protein DRH29_00050 [candidate division Kazan bacterium]
MNLWIIGVAILLLVGVQWLVLVFDRDLRNAGVVRQHPAAVGITQFTHMFLPSALAGMAYCLFWFGINWNLMAAQNFGCADVVGASSWQAVIMALVLASMGGLMLSTLALFIPIGNVLLFPFVPYLLFKNRGQ